MRLLIALAWAALACFDAQAQSGLNDTGSWQCRDADNEAPAPCAGTLQDGDVGRDVDSTRNRPDDGYGGFSFLKVCGLGEQAGTGSCPAAPEVGQSATRWRCTKDRITGLLWEVKLKTTKGGPFQRTARFTRLNPDEPGYGGAGDAASLVAQANAEAVCGKSNWRLPTVNELQSIVHYGLRTPGPMVDLSFLPNVMGVGYWTSNNFAGSVTQAWLVNIANGVVGPDERRNLGGVMLVSGPAKPPAYPGSKLQVSEDGSEVLDPVAKLIWRRCSEGQTWDGLTCAGTPRTFGRAGALVYGARQTDGWRLPNAKELRTLVDLGRVFPAFDPTLFPGTTTEGPYWTSTPKTDSAPDLWYVASGNGATHIDFHTAGSVRLVRAAP
jgi:Protein of unknown function (DUF1566)